MNHNFVVVDTDELHEGPTFLSLVFLPIDPTPTPEEYNHVMRLTESTSWLSFSSWLILIGSATTTESFVLNTCVFYERFTGSGCRRYCGYDECSHKSVLVLDEQPQGSSETECSDRCRGRRKWIGDVTRAAGCAPILSAVLTATLTTPPTVANAASSSLTSPIEGLTEARDALNSLLENWKRATIDCTYADVPRELLEAKNKDLLLEKASTFALFDKSVSVESCKTSNRIVRDYIGATGKGPLVGIEKILRLGLDAIASDENLDTYVTGTFPRPVLFASLCGPFLGMISNTKHNIVSFRICCFAFMDLSLRCCAVEIFQKWKAFCKLCHVRDR